MILTVYILPSLLITLYCTGILHVHSQQDDTATNEEADSSELELENEANPSSSKTATKFQKVGSGFTRQLLKNIP